MKRKIALFLSLLLLSSCISKLWWMPPQNIVEAYFNSENMGYSEAGLVYLSEEKREQRQRMLDNPLSKPMIDILGNLNMEKDFSVTNYSKDADKAFVDVRFKTMLFDIETTITLVWEKGWKIDSFGNLDL